MNKEFFIRLLVLMLSFSCERDIIYGQPVSPQVSTLTANANQERNLQIKQFHSVNKRELPLVQIYDIRCQAMDQPMGVDVMCPSFCWKIASSGHDIIQYAYQVIVSGSLEDLHKEAGSWNSGKIITNQNTFVYYHGTPLKSASKYYWKVKVWIKGVLQPFYSKPSFFVTGLLREGEWNPSKWIAFEKLEDGMKVFPGVHGFGNHLGNKALKRAVVPCFRKDIEIHKDIKQAFVFVCGLGQYVLYLNGKRVDSSFCSPAWSDYTKRCYYNTYDVTNFLKKGSNTIGAIAGAGFLYINRERYRKFVVAEDYPMLRLKMFIRFADGSSKIIVTDTSWKTSSSAITYSSIYGGEDYNANKEKKVWDMQGYDDAAWQKVITVTGPAGKLRSQEDYPVKANAIFRPVHIDSTRHKDFVFDFAQNISGIIRLKVSGKKGYRVRITPAEILSDDGFPDQNASGKPYYWNYTMNGKGTETWQPLFSYYGFRYASVEVFNSEGEKVPVGEGTNSLTLLSLHTQNAAPQVGNFSCSDTLFNKIFSLIKWGIRNNLSNVSTDCPHREKLGWLEQTYLMGNSIQYNYDILSFYRKIIADMQDAQLPNGLVPDIAPEYVIFQNSFRDSPEWGSASVLVPWYLYRWYGDQKILEDHYPMMKKYVEYLQNKSVHYLLNYGLGDWFDLGPNPPGSSQLTPSGLTASAYFFYDASILQKVSGLLHDRDSLKYGHLADSIKSAFNRKYFNDRTKVYGSGSETSFAVPLYFGLVEPAKRKKVFNNFVDSIRNNGYRLTAGDIGFRYVLQVLEQGDASNVIYRMNHNSDLPGYGFQIRKGATSLTESWKALKNVSNDHMMLGHLMEWFYSGLGGICQQKNRAGYREIQVAPQFLPEINWVKCDYKSINGPVKIGWQRTEQGIVHLKVEIPVNTTAEVLLPADFVSVFTDDKKKITVPFQLQSKDDYSRQVKVLIGSGAYLFQFQQNNLSNKN